MADETSQPPVGDAEQQATGSSEPVTETAAEDLAKEDVHVVEPSPEAKWKENAQAAQEADPEKFPRLKKLARAYWAKKKWTIPVSVIALLVLLLGVPFTRYPILGLALKKNVPVIVTDSATGQPVTTAAVTVDGKTIETDNHGQALLKLKVGKHSVKISKKYYKDYDSSVFVGVTGNPSLKVGPVATGRQVPITITDYISGKPLEDAVITASGSSAKTDKQGMATLVLPAKGTDAKATIRLNGYNDTSVSVLITSRAVTTNKFKITPTGKLYFLSNLSGNIDVVKTDLDGKNRKTVLAGTGKEDAGSTSLLASRDWKYLALLSKRDGNQGVYLINTSSDDVTNIDGGNANATFSLVGWSGSTFVYETQRSNITSWQSGAQVLKSYDAAGGKLYTLDQTQGEGTSTYDYGFQNFSTIALLNNEVVYAKNWYSSQLPDHLSGKSSTLYSVHPDGSSKKSIKDFAVPTGTSYAYAVSLSQYEPYSVYVQVPNGSTTTYYAYEEGTITQRNDVTDDTWNKPYPTYLVSPSGKATFWSDVRDNKNTLLVGNNEGAAGKQIATLSNYVPYGWYSDNYLLVSKNGSELYVMPTDGSTQPVKITDYYKPQLTYRGYGGGYGGI
ncbi:MAG TPA: hypothetical protein VN031_02535 [Candidatus Microsaccharimonas sp.]|nr:hypothetical protein [Candidatus Microsaccharimonas sp.]